MTAAELLEFITSDIPTFIDTSLVSGSRAYHYTPHADAIAAAGKFFGAPITGNLDQTQTTLHPEPADCDPGVVFCYEILDTAAEEAFVCDNGGPTYEIFEIEFKCAVRALHRQEAARGATHSLLVLTTDIISYRRLGVTKADFRSREMQ